MAAILITDVVSDSIDGSGIFDVLMTAVELRLKEQYDSGRIQGSDYASVYLGGMQSVLQQSIAFVLGKQTADKQADSIIAQTELLNQKILTEQAQILDTVDGNAVAGVIGKQKTLYTNQATGFTRNAEVAAVKAFTDIWTVAKSTDPDAASLALPLHVDQSSMDVILAKLALNALDITENELGTPSSEGSNLSIANAVDPGAGAVIITIAAHGLTTGDAIRITGVTGMTELNDNNYIVTVTAANTFTLDGTDGVAHTAYVSGGTVTVL